MLGLSSPNIEELSEKSSENEGDSSFGSDSDSQQLDSSSCSLSFVSSLIALYFVSLSKY